MIDENDGLRPIFTADAKDAKKELIFVLYWRSWRLGGSNILVFKTYLFRLC